jgi:hypothetical protein
MQVSHPNINTESIKTTVKYYLHHTVDNPLGNEGVFHLSKGEWKKIKIIYLGNATFTKIELK